MNVTQTKFSLAALIREVSAASISADPGVIAQEVEHRIPVEHIEDALRETLRSYVKEVGRTTALTFPAEGGKPAPCGKPNGQSWKRNGIREGWRAHLRARVHVGPDPSDWKLLGQCGYDDLMFAVEERRTIAARTAARADHMEELARLLRLHGVAQVSDLPDDALASHLREDPA